MPMQLKNVFHEQIQMCKKDVLKAKTNEHMMKQLETDGSILLFERNVFHLILLIYRDPQSS